MQGMLALIPDEATFVHNILNFGRFLKYGGFVITPAACSLSLKSGRSLKLRGQGCRPLPMGTHLLQPRSWFANAGDFFLHQHLQLPAYAWAENQHSSQLGCRQRGNFAASRGFGAGV